MLFRSEARLAIEPAAAGLAAARRGEDDLQALRTQLARQREAETVSDSFEANRAFHLAIVSAARNLHLLRVAQSVWGGREGVRAYELMRPAVAERDLAEHGELLAAIARGESEGAERLAREHVVARSDAQHDERQVERRRPARERDRREPIDVLGEVAQIGRAHV